MPDITPNYVTTAADGSVSADFKGNIKADSLTLPADTTVALNSRRISWRKVATDALTSYLSSGINAVNQIISILSAGSDTDTGPDATPRQAQIICTADPNASLEKVTIQLREGIAISNRLVLQMAGGVVTSGFCMSRNVDIEVAWQNYGGVDGLSFYVGGTHVMHIQVTVFPRVI